METLDNMMDVQRRMTAAMLLGQMRGARLQAAMTMAVAVAIKGDKSMDDIASIAVDNLSILENRLHRAFDDQDHQAIYEALYEDDELPEITLSELSSIGPSCPLTSKEVADLSNMIGAAISRYEAENVKAGGNAFQFAQQHTQA